MKRKTVALFNPYLDTLGGGEKHVLSILQVLTNKADYHPVIFWDTDLTKDIEKKLDIRFKTEPVFKKNIFSGKGSFIDKVSALKDIDIFLYVTDGSYFFSSAKKNYVFCMVPKKELYSMSFINIVKTTNYRFISNSRFTQTFLSKQGIRSEMLYPYISQEYLTENPQKKQDTILVVGRFFEHLHSKRQDKAIEAFRQLKKSSQYNGYRLQLAGSVLPSDMPYLEKLKSMAKGDSSIEFYVNIPFEKMQQLYSRATYYWHFTGYEIDETIQPYAVEHLGITPLEAMASGAITCCYKAGGPKEIILDGKTGLLFSSTEELIKKMALLNVENRSRIQQNAQAFVRENFNYDIFATHVLELFDIPHETS